MKLLGAFIVVAASAALGHLEACKRERRVRELAASVAALTLLESHVVFGQCLLADALDRVAGAHPEVRHPFLWAARRLREGCSASRAWTEGLESWPEKALLPADLTPLYELAGILGLSAADDQARHFRWARSQLEARLSTARERLPESARLCRALGACGGLTLALLLL